MEAAEFLGIERVPGTSNWRLTVLPDIATPGNFLFGGCGLGGALVALESMSGRPTVWATAQYLSHAPTGSVVEFEVTLAAVGGNITQGRSVARVDGHEILTVNAAMGTPHLPVREVYVHPPRVPPPEDCPGRYIPPQFANSILDRIDVRLAKGHGFTEKHIPAGDPDSALWARIPGNVGPSAATLGIFGDYLSGGATQPLGQRTMGRSLDNTLRIVQLAQTEWVLCDIRMHAIYDGYAQGVVFLWSREGVLLATASQTFSVKFWPEDAFPG